MRDEIGNLSVASDASNNDECFVMNLDDSSSPGTQWTAVNIADATVIYDVSRHNILLRLHLVFHPLMK